jgi:hypothetical protein
LSSSDHLFRTLLVRTWILLLVVPAVFASVYPAAAQQRAVDGDPEIEQVQWLTGCWNAGGDVDESWSNGKGGQLFGINRSYRAGRVVRWEFLRIYEGRSTLIYAAAPSHQPPAEFRARVMTRDSIIFEKPEHDFPTVLAYRRVSGDSLLVEVSGPGESGETRGFALRFERVACTEPR